jgi:hypothetical protein
MFAFMLHEKLKKTYGELCLGVLGNDAEEHEHLHTSIQQVHVSYVYVICIMKCMCNMSRGILKILVNVQPPTCFEDGIDFSDFLAVSWTPFFALFHLALFQLTT